MMRYLVEDSNFYLIELTKSEKEKGYFGGILFKSAKITLKSSKKKKLGYKGILRFLSQTFLDFSA